ncbi:MAG: prepilin-type N-terminal cleavage/methylation domain-containing protein [Patescibacteria group bacterium]
MNIKKRGFTLITDFFKKKRSDMSSGKNYGFTLIEILVVLAIIGILIGLSIVAFSAASKAARDNKRKTDLAEIRSNIEIYRTDCGEYPAAVTFGGALNGGTAACSGNVYMSLVPRDPQQTTGTRSYYYSRTTTNTYELCAALEQGGSATCGGACTVACNFRLTNP